MMSAQGTYLVNVSTTVPNYPLAEKDASFFAAARVVRKTGSYSTQRAMAVAGYASLFAAILAFGIAMAGVVAVYVHGAVGGVLLLVVCLGLAFGLVPFVERRLWGMRAAFSYLITQALCRQYSTPAGNASEMGQQALAMQFGDLGAIADAHNRVQSLVRSFFKTFDKLDGVLPFDFGPVRTVLAWITNRVSPRIADLALSFAVARGDRNFEDASKDAVVYVAQNPKAIVGTAVRAHITEKVLGGIVGFFFMAISFAAIFATVHSLADHATAAASTKLPAQGAQIIALFAAGFAGLFVGIPVGSLASWFVRTAILEPIALTMLIIRFHGVIQGQRVNPAIKARIQSASNSLRSVRGVMNFVT